MSIHISNKSLKLLMKHVTGAVELVLRVKVPAAKLDDPSLISGAHEVEVDNQPPKVLLWTASPSP